MIPFVLKAEQIQNTIQMKDSRIQGFKNIYLTKKIHAFLIITPQIFILWDQNQFHTTYIEASTVDIEN